MIPGSMATRAAVGLCLALLAAPDNAPFASPRDVSDWGAIRQLLQLDYKVHDIGNVRMFVSNSGQLGSRPGSNSPGANEPSLEWPKGSGVDYLWVAGLWIGAVKNGEVHVTTTQFTPEVRPGAGPNDFVRVTFEGALDGARSPAPNADDDTDGRFNEDRLNGRDDDLDGRVDEDFAAISDQEFFAEFADDDPAIRIAFPDHVPLEVRLEQATLTWRDPRIDSFVGLDYLIVNRGFNPLDNLSVGLFADCDIGPRAAQSVAEDDLAGFWEGIVAAELGGPSHDVKVSMGYMFDADGDAGQTEGWVGVVFLGARAASQPPLELKNFRMFSGQAAFANGGDPNNDVERDQVLKGTDPTPLPPPDPITGLRPAQLATNPSDYRVVVSAEQLPTLDPGESLRVDFGLVVGRGFAGLVANAARAKLLYENDWRVEGPTAVTLQDFEASSSSEGVQLSWHLSANAELRAVHLQRAEAAVGPYTELARLEPGASMHYVDRDVAAGHTYWYRLGLALETTALQMHGPIQVQVQGVLPTTSSLGTPVTTAGGVSIRYDLSSPGPFDLAVFDVRGRRITTLDRGNGAPGSYVQLWDRRDASGGGVSRGVYVVRLVSGRATSTRKVVLTQE